MQSQMIFLSFHNNVSEYDNHSCNRLWWKVISDILPATHVNQNVQILSLLALRIWNFYASLPSIINHSLSGTIWSVQNMILSEITFMKMYEHCPVPKWLKPKKSKFYEQFMLWSCLGLLLSSFSASKVYILLSAPYLELPMSQ